MKFLLVSFIVIAAAVAASAADSTTCTGLSTAQCAKVSAVTAKWSPALRAIEVGQVTGTDTETGACKYNETEDRVDLEEGAFALSNTLFERCLATAYSHARYAKVEAEWLTHLGEHEAWIIRDGQMVKVRSSTSKKLEEPAARQLWVTFATRELAPGTADRAIASTTPADGRVRELLGFPTEATQ
jgi:hypothetical protein